ncbi:aldehyde dehydrogenase family protein [Arthrobacter sp. W4I7]|uniref:aldehyde dehydrogenase family protein n=1 Tax=Arthrobacter sp. W4I7 TaxID=3042296 RepID=UPI00278A6812|nr:aldehyde dehydrogenase family protein [Arthrobacter sp. W4I7]MDQ0691392.1 succinate-semialdehyde dehydrogenase/glutarate-semialdehyde dehydrogenase [Arthrobacter sp. W4I7]
MTYSTINPFTNELIKEFLYSTDAEIDAALDRASEAFKSWSRTPLADRAAIFIRAAQLLRERAVELGELATIEMGKLSAEATMEPRLMAAPLLEWVAENANDVLRPRPLSPDGPVPSLRNPAITQEVLMTYQPQGIVYEIEPWNVPYYQAVRGFAPAAISGNVVILKHASNVPQCAAAVVAILREAGLPEGVWQNVYATHAQSDRIIADERVRAVTMTGSAAVGSKVAAAAGKALRKSVLELGGSDAMIVLPDADLDAAINGASGRFFNCGQTCVSPKRMIVTDGVYEEFIARLSKKFDHLKPGDPADPETTLGPLSSQDAADGLKAQIAAAVAGGATATPVGPPVPTTGAFVQPTILTGVTTGNPAFYEEFFGPVLIVFRVADVDSAIELANDSLYGLAGSVWSQNINAALDIAAQLDTGNVAINQTSPSGSAMQPFGGVKSSGFGREMGAEGILEFCNIKSITFPPGMSVDLGPALQSGAGAHATSA